MSFKPLFAKSLGAAPERLHFAAHSHHLWPDASFEGQVECWEDAATRADHKWDKVMDEVWPEAQARVAGELGTGDAQAIVFASNTHDFLIRLAAASPRRAGNALRVLTSDGEFHSARRQMARWAETGEIELTRVKAEPFDDFSARFLEAARSGEHDLILVSQILFNNGRIFDRVAELAALARPDGPWVVIDSYHAFMAIGAPISPVIASSAFVLGGGYKYAMAGEGMGFMHCPPGFGGRPPITGWFAEFGELTAPPGSSVGYTRDAMRFMGATFDPSALYRFVAIQRMLEENGITTERVAARVANLQARLIERLAGTALGEAELLNPIDGRPHARFLAFREDRAQRWCAQLDRQNIVTDVRGNVLRIGFGLYHDEEDVDLLADAVRKLA
ncbi:aminotransferase class V-fold PLP-dependent enzyme [Sphingomonas sp. RB56-2]|uniref:Aminotransferase class V-fold PLP-dependent enzyme n=1 Tax=Sphingomonas brevis TaxID=2908206 RepID=A0ABT0SAY3_9SPHN|nr:aminotransferase class V-fold PLP-dependent enzyme [Sphingomonas brevis]MCL6741543.1 aminotransferase class V-fold PLP-dependent enzyme [Sphingomonas brevis]